MKNKGFQDIKNDLQIFFKDIENGKYGQRIKELFIWIKKVVNKYGSST